MLAIEQDIRSRGLKPGQLYQSAREIAELFGVSPMTADRAMRKLATNGLLQRRHGSGTYVGEAAQNSNGSPPRTLHIWVPATFYAHYRVILENIVKTLHLAFPGDSIQQFFLPDDDQLAFCKEITGAWAAANSMPRSVVLVACSEAVQRLVKHLGVPVIANGGINKGACEIPWTDMDYRQAGRLLAEYAANNGGNRILVLMNRLWGLGDNEFLEGIEQGIRESGRDNIDARVRSVELEPHAIETHLRRALRAGNPPSAVICSSKVTASVAVRVAESVGMRVPDDFLVATVRVRAPQAPGCRYAYTRWAISRESNAALHTMVQQINQGHPPEPDHYVIPVELVAPESLALWEPDQA